MLKDTREAIGETSAFVLTGLFWLAIALPTISVVGYGVYYFSAPAKVAIENRTFHKSQAYQDGMARGHLHKVCDSIGYGLPYATQYTNPGKAIGAGQAIAVLPQADPNGLFSPSSAEGTWINCLNPTTKSVGSVSV